MKNSKSMSKILAFALILIMIASIVPLTVSAINPAAFDIVPADSVAISNQNYRNLNLHPGGEEDEMRFTWHSQSTTGSVRIYETGSATLVQEVHSTTQVLTARSEDSIWFPGITPDYTVHHVIVTGLLPSTDYEYVVVGADFESLRKPFRTGGDDIFRFLVVGDPQIGTNYQPTPIAYTSWNNTINVAMNQVPDANFLLSTGDQVHTNAFSATNNPGSFEERLIRSQYMYDILLSPSEFHSLPFVPVIGNHEVGSDNPNGHLWHLNYGTVNPESSGTALRNTRRLQSGSFHADYYMRWGDMLLIQLDSHIRTTALGPGSTRYAWLTEVLERHSDATWRIATFHHPPYSSFRASTLSEKTQLIANWIPTLERHNFDVVLNGHCHAYARSRQMYNNAPVLNQQWIDADGNVNVGTNATNAVLDPTGIVYIVLNAAAGSGFYNLAAIDDREYLAVYNQNFMRNFSVAEVTPNTFSIATYQVNNDDTTTLVDVYTIVRSDNGAMPSGITTRQMGDAQWGTFVRASIEGVYVPIGTTLADIEALLPVQAIVETDIRNNDYGTPETIRNPHGEYGRFVRPLTAGVIWDMASITPEFDPNSTSSQTYRIRGSIVGVAGDSYVYTDIVVGNPSTPFNGYISYFGARYRFYGRSNYNFLYDSFDSEIFSGWIGGGEHPHGAQTPIGFGSPLSLANAGSEHFSGSLATVIPVGSASYQRGTLGGRDLPGVHTFTYFSRTFNMPDDFHVDNIINVRGAHHIDDVMVLFINGREIYRTNTNTTNANVYIGRRMSSVYNWNTYVGHNTDARLRTFHINYDFSARDSGYMRINTPDNNMFDAASRTNLELALRPGENVITAVVGNNAAASSDLWFNLELYIELDSVIEYPNLSALDFAISNAQTQNVNVYTAESVQAMQYMLDAAIAIRDDELATQQAVNNATAALNAAIRELVSDGYISYFGARHRFYGRTNSALMTDAFNPNIFLNWVGGGDHPQGAQTPIGFGTPMSVANAGGIENYSGQLATLIPNGEGPHLRHGIRNEVLSNHTFTYFSRTFNLPDDFDVNSIGEVRGAHHIDDNMVLFINGIEIYRFNIHATDANIVIGRPVGWEGFLGLNTDARLRRFHIDYDYNVRDSGYPSLAAGRNLIHAASRTNLELALRPGQNVITAVVGNNSASSSDLWFDLELFIEILEDNQPVVPTITGISVGDNEVTVALVRPSTAGAFLIVVTYNYDDNARTMISTAQPTAIIPESSDDMIIPIDLTGADRVKAMIWNLSTLNPLSGYYEIALQ